MSDRFYTFEIEGYPIHPGSESTHGSRKAPSIAVSVLDRLWNHAEVARFDQGTGHIQGRFGWQSAEARRQHAREQASEACATLNALHEEAMRA